jgi:dTDP-4-amino-4,6-dideoxygalactose transaminase
MAEIDVAVNVHYKPLPMLTLYKELNYKIEKFPVAYQCYKNEISLPVYFNLKNEEVKFVANSIISIVNKEIK